MQRIYLDNAATTPLDKEVLEAMMPYLTDKFGNPSSIYSYGRETRLAIENARKSVAKILNVKPSEIFFTSGGTESTNTAINAAVKDLGCGRIISSPIEHHATLHTVEHLHKRGKAALDFVKLLPDGNVDLQNLEELIQNSKEKCVVSLMHANNEIGTMLPLQQVGAICEKYNAIFHTDAVQTVAHFPLDLKSTTIHFISASAHKFHGPKGVGIIYINENVKINAYLQGGSQERNMRAGTENIYGIVGFAKALEIATANYEQDKTHIMGLRDYMMQQLQQYIAGVSFNGNPSEHTLYTVLSANFPMTAKSEMLVFSLDINNICVSAGSACTSGAEKGSHVIAAVQPNDDLVTVRFSFSKHNTKEEIDFVVDKLKTLV